MSAYRYEERCSCGALFEAVANYLPMSDALRWREEHKHIEPLAVVKQRVLLPRARLRVRRMPTVPRRTPPDFGTAN